MSFTDEKKIAYLNHLRGGMRKGAAAKAIGYDRSTIWYHEKNDEKFAKAIEDAEMEANEVIEDALFKAAKEGNVTACQVWLYNRMPDRWRDKRNVEHTGGGGGPIVFEVDIEAMSGHNGANGEDNLPA